MLGWYVVEQIAPPQPNLCPPSQELGGLFPSQYLFGRLLGNPSVRWCARSRSRELGDRARLLQQCLRLFPPGVRFAAWLPPQGLHRARRSRQGPQESRDRQGRYGGAMRCFPESRTIAASPRSGHSPHLHPATLSVRTINVIGKSKTECLCCPQVS